MKNMIVILRKTVSFILLLVILLTGSACMRHDKIKVSESHNTITLENNYVKVVFNKIDGGIREYLNKEKNLYFVKGKSDATPVRIAAKSSNISTNVEKELLPEDFSYELIKNEDEIKILFNWEFSNKAVVIGSSKIIKGTNEVIFNVELKNNVYEETTYSIEYPIFEGIDTLKDYENDYIVSPFAMGYLFKNPIQTFQNSNKSIKGINKYNGFYPSGMYQSMQFFGYYSRDIGGFYVQTRDGKGSEKSFTFTETDGLLRASIWHYLPDLKSGDTIFDYDIVCTNLVEGTWYEAAEIYKKWAVKQKWCQEKGKNDDRSDLNIDLYEKTTLCNFIMPSRKDQEGVVEIYDTIRTTLKQKTLVIPYYWMIPPTPTKNDTLAVYNHFNANTNSMFIETVKGFDDLIAYFEYFNCSLSTTLPEGFENNAMVNQKGVPTEAVFGDTRFILQCPSDDWNDLVYAREHILSTKLEASGYYNDIGIGAFVKTLCYDTNHSHGTRVSVMEESLNQLKEVYEISREYNGFTGQEMISEVMIPYVDIYQCRSNAGEMGGMENDIIMEYVKEGTAEKIHLFEYIYSQYCGIRLDGFTLPLSSVGTPYYYVTAFTALNGGIPEYNWEWTGDNTYPKANDYDQNMIKFISELGNSRLTYGKNYLVYGSMVEPPKINISKNRYDYSTPINNDDGSWSGFDNQGNRIGSMLCDDVVVSAFKSRGKVAIFLCNITNKNIQLNFSLDAFDLYNIKSGKVHVYINGIPSLLTSISSGKANISINLPSHKVVMIELE